MRSEISIIGAGIGGLTTALTLKQRGLAADVFEGAPAINPVGAGIIIANNAMQVFQKLNLQKKIETAGNKMSVMKITNAQLNPLFEMDITKYQKKYGISSVAIHRAALQQILVNEIGYANIHLSKQLSKIDRLDFFKLTFEDHTTIESKTVIGADGIKSVVRSQLFEKATVRHANQICWRGICEIELPLKYRNEAVEAWGKGKRFGFVKIDDTKVYWYALLDSKGTPVVQPCLEDLFSEFHPDIIRIISATSMEQIIVNEITDLKPIARWQSKNVCLIGDAAHATTPNLGQGACQAIEDAYMLGKLLDRGISLAGSFEEYERLRKKKALSIVRRSWALGKVAHWSNPFLVGLRDRAIRMTPNFVKEKQMDEIFELG
jgi:2-polyprenyl-6-methoxyphenol hydroxylase-like FAD-dependent oxidoreductase